MNFSSHAFVGIFLHSVDRFNEDSEHAIPTAERSNLRPLLDGIADTAEEAV